MESSIRARRVAIPAATIVVMAVGLLGAMANGRRAQRLALDAMTSELRIVQQAISTALDSTKLQLEMAQHLIGWLELKEEASSAALVNSISKLRHRHQPPASLDAVTELAATGQLDVVRDAGLRRRLLALDRRLAATNAASDAAFERYRTRLEEALAPGMWRYVFYGESGKYVVDFRATLRELHAAGFDRAVRSLQRGLLNNRAELEALHTESGTLLSEIQRAHGIRAEP